MKIKKLSRHYIFLAVIFWIIYCGVSLLTPLGNTPEQLNISPTALRFLMISFYLPFLICWIFAISACINFWNFTRTLPEGTLQNGFWLITLGLTILTIDLTIPGTIGVLYGFFGGDTNEAGWVIFNRYLDILLPILSFIPMYIGSVMLVHRTDQKVSAASKLITAILPATIFSIFYIYMIFTDPTRQISTDPLIPATYFLADSLIIITVVIPVIATWVLGLLLVQNLDHYSHHTRTVNRSGLVTFYNGMLVIIAATIIVQALNSLGSTRFQDISLGLVIFLLYVLIIFITLGLGLIARGAKNLYKPTRKPSHGTNG
jgi:hypothetical protein